MQGRAATMKKIPDITEQALKKALGELERSIRDTKRESRATDERVAAMDSQRAQLADEVASAHDRSAFATPYMLKNTMLLAVHRRQCLAMITLHISEYNHI